MWIGAGADASKLEIGVRPRLGRRRDRRRDGIPGGRPDGDLDQHGRGRLVGRHQLTHDAERPPVADTAAVSNGGTCLVTAGDTVSITQLWAGDSTTGGAGTIGQSGGTVNAGVAVAVGHAGKATGVYNLSGGVPRQTGATAGVDGIRVFGNAASGPAATVLLVGGSAVLTDAAEFSVDFTNGTNVGAAAVIQTG